MCSNSHDVLIHSARITFFNKLSSAVRDAEKFWYTLRKIHPRFDIFSILTHGSISASSNQDKATLLNKFFVSWFNDTFVTSSHSTPKPDDANRELVWADSAPEGVISLMKAIKFHSSAGPDGITAWMRSMLSVDNSPLSSLY